MTEQRLDSLGRDHPPSLVDWGGVTITLSTDDPPPQDPAWGHTSQIPYARYKQLEAIILDESKPQPWLTWRYRLEGDALAMEILNAPDPNQEERIAILTQERDEARKEVREWEIAAIAMGALVALLILILSIVSL